MSAALFMQLSKRMRHAIVQSAACPALPHFSTLSHQGNDFLKDATEHKMCVLKSSTTFI